jgi:iron complex outermembrane recepter protein
MKLFFLFLAFFFLSSSTIVRAQGTISGTVKGADKQASNGAIVTLQRATGNIVIKTVITEPDGSFEFLNLKKDSFVISVTNIGYQKYLSEPIIINDRQLEVVLAVIELKAGNPVELTNVTVVSKVPFVEKKIDRTVINPDALISNAGTNALDVLEKSPGVQVDQNGVISLKGRQGVVVYIDDKPTYLSAADLANYLRSLPSGSLGLIEIMTNPPAKYDAAGNAGVINIKLKRTKTVGFNGSINASYGQGVYARTNNSVNLNYRVNKINFFSNISYNINNGFQDLYIKRQYYTPGGTLNALFNQNSFIKWERSGANLKLGLDYYLNKKTTMGIVLTGFSNTNNNTTTNNAELLNGNQAVQNKVNAISPSERIFKNGSINLNYVYKLNEKGAEFSLNADYIAYDSDMDQSLLNTIFMPDGSFVSKTNLISRLPATINIKTAKADYTLPLKHGARFEAGMKTSFINTKNVADFFDEANNILTINNDFSNNFRYNENINAAYINYSREGKKFAIQAGLRFENTAIKGNQLGNAVRKDSSFTRDYNSFFPTLYLSYKLDSVDKHQLGFSYGRRIDRPNYQDLNPFTYPLDRFTLYSGNPFLQPTFSNNFELSHTYKNRITTTLQFSYTKDVINETIEQSSNIFYSRPGNLGKQISYGISVNASFQPTKWWTIQCYTELMYNEFTADIYNQQLNNRGTLWYIGPVNIFQINKSWNAELGGSYQTRVAVAQFVTIPVWNMRAGIGKKVLKDKGTIRMNLSDLFYSNQPGGDIKSLANSAASWLSYLDSRVLTLSFSYRFNKGKGLAARATGASDAERSRVK